MSGFDFDAVVVGAGAVGLACGYALALRGLSTVVLEAGPRIGEGVSARNSEVVHGGLYYPTGSLKARLCVQGRRSLYAFLAERGVAFDRCGKLVVFNGPEELERLDAILTQARTNDVEGMEVLTPAQVRALEPDLKCDAALLSPQSGVFDSHGYMLALQGEIESRGGAVVVSTPFEGAAPLATGGWRVSTGGDDPAVLTTARLVTAPGLDAQSVADRISGLPSGTIPQGFFGKGVYFRLTGRAPFSRLVYPPPHPGGPGDPLPAGPRGAGGLRAGSRVRSRP